MPAVRQLDLNTEPDDILLTTIQSEPFNCVGHSVNLTISPRDDPRFKYSIRKAFASDQLALSEYSYPVKSLQREYAHLQDAVLHDIHEAKPFILIGSDHADLILPQTPICFGPSNAPVAVCTKLGWTLQGLAKDITSANRECCLLTSNSNPSTQLMDDVVKLWKAEVIPFTSKAVTRSKLDNFAVKILESKTVNVSNGETNHYATPLLRKPDCTPLHAGKESVMGSLRSVEKRLCRDPDLADIHNQKIQELVDKDYVQIINESEAASTTESWFIPHHVIRQHEKYRLVFNCSYEYSGQALNNHLLPGSNLCSSLLGVFLRFRQKPVAISGDIQAMFHQIRLLPEDRCLLRFLWRNLQRDREPDIYEWKVLPFGTTCSPCCATFALRKHAIDNQTEYPEIAQSILQSFYVDNCLESVSNVTEAKELIVEMRKLLAIGGFNMRQWASNSEEVIRDLPTDAKSESCELWLAQENEDPKESTLGLSWNCVEDEISYKYRPISYHQLTMKVVYRILASQYDPLGYLSPYLARAKVLVRDLWIKKRQWDEPIEPAANLQLHIFCDASEKVYGAVAYLRTEDEDGESSIAFMSARSRVAPKKCLSIPRLELSAALLGAQLSETLTSELTLPITSVTLWSDSTTVLSWLKSDSCRYKVFVGTRVAEIQNMTEDHSWRYVNTRDNPADDITRGLTLSELSSTNSRWRHGPSFLSDPPEQWPLGKAKFVETLNELKRTFCGIATMLSDMSSHEDWDSAVDSLRSNMCTSDGAAAPDLATCDLEHELFCKIQKESFPEELTALSTGKPLSSSSRLRQLSPEYEPETGLIRVGGRLRNSSDIPSELMHPIVLDPKHPLTKLLIKHYDVKLHHYGSERVFAELRRRFWILRGREAVKRHQRQCYDCQRWRANPEVPKMADLPPRDYGSSSLLSIPPE
ncbi:uncharacterized protein LOC124265959 [Haliotis rubra]|uniref:uncharacterized protein LOC124265959 n=1 Tax=Haliotis rubra TaxID=36100 RepID=UPI001EE53ABC|nr:uncharacterized protein LOC124265959 [Haliotis rubra]